MCLLSIFMVESLSAGYCRTGRYWHLLRGAAFRALRAHQRAGFMNTWTQRWPPNTCRSCVDKPDSWSAGSLWLSVASLSCFFCSFSFSSITEAIFSSLVWSQRKRAGDDWRAASDIIMLGVGSEEMVPSGAVGGTQRSLICAADKQQWLINGWSMVVNYNPIIMTRVSELCNNIYIRLDDLPVYEGCLNQREERKEIRFGGHIIATCIDGSVCKSKIKTNKTRQTYASDMVASSLKNWNIWQKNIHSIMHFTLI